jgi:hypothetical protein
MAFIGLTPIIGTNNGDYYLYKPNGFGAGGYGGGELANKDFKTGYSGTGGFAGFLKVCSVYSTPSYRL